MEKTGLAGFFIRLLVFGSGKRYGFYMQKIYDKYLWTGHARMKMRHYRLTESRIKRIIRFPTRIEEGVLEKGIACMQPDGIFKKIEQKGNRWSKKSQSEIWVMYVIVKYEGVSRLKVITAWRYPGQSPERDPIPVSVLAEVKKIIW